MNRVLFSSEEMKWSTPQDLFDKLDKEFLFDLDVCATNENAKCGKFFSPEKDGLKQEWNGTCWMNPPYGRDIGKWLEKAYKESQKENCKVIALIPARTDTKYWHDWVMKAYEVRLIKGRLKFGNALNSAPFPSVIVVFKKHRNENPLLTTYLRPSEGGES